MDAAWRIEVHGTVPAVRLPVFMLGAMITYTVGVASYVDIAERTAGDRERGVLKAP